MLLIIPLNSNDILRRQSSYILHMMKAPVQYLILSGCDGKIWLWQWVRQAPSTHKRVITDMAFIRTLIVVGVSTEPIFTSMLTAS